MIMRAVGIGGPSRASDRAINHPSMELFDAGRGGAEDAVASGRDQ